MYYTKKEKARETSRLTDEYFVNLISGNYDGIAVYGQKGKIKYVSSSMLSFLGFTKEELVGEKALNIVRKEDEGIVFSKLVKLINGKKNRVKIQHRIKNRDGDFIWVKNTVYNYLKDPEIRGLVSVIKDISNEKEAEEEFDLVYEASDDAIFLVDFSRKRIKSCNSRAVKLFECKKKKELEGRKISVLWNKLGMGRMFLDEISSLDNGGILSKEMEYFTKRGNHFLGSTTISLLDLPLNKIYLIRIKDMRDQLKESRDYEIAINQFAASLIHRSTENEIVWDIAENIGEILKFEDCVIYTTNKAENKLVQRASHGIKNPEGKSIYNPIEIPFGTGVAGTVAQNKLPEIIDDTSLDERYIRDEFRGASEISVPIIYGDTVLGIIDAESGVKGYFTNYHLKVLQTVASFAAIKIMQARANVRIMQNEKKLKTQNLELKKINTELDRFVYSTSHDLKAPLANVSGLIALIRYQSPAEEITHCLDLMDKSILKLNDFIADILNYSRNKRTEFKREKIDFKGLIEECISNLGYYDESINVEIKVDQKNSYVSDSYRLQMILNNLIANSLRYSRDEISSFVKIEVKVTSGRARIKVSDNGIGIEDKHVPKIFNMFYRATRKTSGSGLGLFIVKETVEMLKGKVKVRSKVNNGTVFELDIPELPTKKG